MDYVCEFINETNFDKEMYGKWWKLSRAFNRKSASHTGRGVVETAGDELQILDGIPESNLRPEVVLTTSEDQIAEGKQNRNDGHESTKNKAAKKQDQPHNTNGEEGGEPEEHAGQENEWTTQSYRNNPSYKKNVEVNKERSYSSVVTTPRGRGRQRPTYTKSQTDQLRMTRESTGSRGGQTQ